MTQAQMYGIGAVVMALLSISAAVRGADTFATILTVLACIEMLFVSRVRTKG